MNPKTVESWRIVLTFTDGTQEDFELQHDETTENIDEFVKSEYPVTW